MLSPHTFPSLDPSKTTKEYLIKGMNKIVICIFFIGASVEDPCECPLSDSWSKNIMSGFKGHIWRL